MSTDVLLYRQVGAVKCGQTERFIIKYTPQPDHDANSNPIPPNLWLKVKNTESIALRAAYLAGPYVLYVDCTPEAYDSQKQCFITADQPVFEPQLLPGQSVYAELSCHSLKPTYTWTVDVVSQTIFNNTINVDFEITIGTSKKILHDLSFQNDSQPIPNSDKLGTFVSSDILLVKNHDTLDLWNLPLIKNRELPIHLVILTHGLHSNVSADMLYLKEEIDKTSSTKESVVVKGFFGNVGKTERGIKYLGSRVAEFVIDLVTKNEAFNQGKTTKISFVGHSLGGLVQTFAIAYIENNFPWFFKSIRPMNFIAIASPLLGVVHENPMYVKLALSAGFVGKTGQDLGLVFLEGEGEQAVPLLYLLPTGPTHKVLKRFRRRTVYANTRNDGIVPLRTSALLYLDYKGVLKVMSNNEKGTNMTSSESNENDQEVATKIPNSETLDSVKVSNGISPVQAMLSFFMPQKQSNAKNQYLKFQTGGGVGSGRVDESGSGDEGNVMGAGSHNSGGEGLLRKSSVLETATSLILPPLPSFKYITDPGSRDDIIVHDKVYYEKDIPPRAEEGKSKEEQSLGFVEKIRGILEAKPEPTVTTVSAPEENKNDEYSTTSPSLRKRLVNSLDDVEHLEEEIAREYHKQMSWRKVLVQLRPDAHNNIIVRRRYANAYGWPVVSHIVSNHFGIEEYEPPVAVKETESQDDLEDEVDLSRILSRDLISKQNEEVDEVESEVKPKEANHWINSKDDSESIFAVGPTGLLSDVSEMMGSLKDHWYGRVTTTKTENPDTGIKNDNSPKRPSFKQEIDESSVGQELDSEQGDLCLTNRVVGEFV
ncbi:putative lipase Rog1p [[Candida] railenensis]|uniref:Lipase Rog1p n=1 Tax=[Candida] railenensis TaxID=45579 RepID=A0A9P0QT99_9ASCO|nr:putative lipase Rog1p [[Candida] railenensis]